LVQVMPCDDLAEGPGPTFLTGWAGPGSTGGGTRAGEGRGGVPGGEHLANTAVGR